MEMVMPATAHAAGRTPQGSIDYDYYRAVAATLRRDARSTMLRQGVACLVAWTRRLIRATAAIRFNFQYSGVPGTKASNAAQN